MKNIKMKISRILTAITAVLALTLSVSATSDAGTTASAITDVGSALNGILGYLGDVTSNLLSNDLWILGMGFFVISFVAGFVMYLFKVGRR